MAESLCDHAPRGSAAALHGVDGPSRFEPGRGWVRQCLCGREFVSYQEWQHVPALFDHLAVVGARRV